MIKTNLDNEDVVHRLVDLIRANRGFNRHLLSLADPPEDFATQRASKTAMFDDAVPVRETAAKAAAAIHARRRSLILRMRS